MEVILKILAYDQPGVLDRIAGLIRRNGWNVKTLTAGNVSDGITQINMSLSGHNVNLDILGERLLETYGVCSWEHILSENALVREMVLCRLPDSTQPIASREGIRLLELEEPGVFKYAEFTGTPEDVSAFMQEAREQQVDCVRSGVLILDRGEQGI